MYTCVLHVYWRASLLVYVSLTIQNSGFQCASSVLFPRNGRRLQKVGHPFPNGSPLFILSPSFLSTLQSFAISYSVTLVREMFPEKRTTPRRRRSPYYLSRRETGGETSGNVPFRRRVARDTRDYPFRSRRKRDVEMVLWSSALSTSVVRVVRAVI